MRVLILYNFSTEERHVEAPNFYRSTAASVFPELGIQVAFLPDLNKTRAFRLARSIGLKRSTALAIAGCWWIRRNKSECDMVVGWIDHGIAAAFLRFLARWDSPQVVLILYRLGSGSASSLRRAAAHVLLRAASRGAGLLLTLDSAQARAAEDLLGREPGTTVALQYGVDANWYSQYLSSERVPRVTRVPTIFAPGSAHRDDETLLKAVEDLPVEVRRFMLGKRGGTRSTATEMLGVATIRYSEGAPYAEYVEECLASALVVIAVFNCDAPVGLTSLLECMALGKAIIATRGASTSDYVTDGLDALLYEQGDFVGLRSCIRRLLEEPGLAIRLGKNARKKAAEELDLRSTGVRFAELLLRLHRDGVA